MTPTNFPYPLFLTKPWRVTKIEYFGTYLRYLSTNPMSPHCDNFPTNPRSYPVGSQIPVTPNMIAELVCFFPETL